MKALDRYILEKFQITKNSKYEDSYTCQPTNKFELRKILEERLFEDKNADLNDIDVSNITDMGYKGFPYDDGLFEDLDPHNIKIDKWDMSNVENMNSMFYHCGNFNCDLSGWDVSKVKDMRYMFFYCKKFEGERLEKWNPAKCKNMYYMFYGCDLLKNKPSWYHE